MTVSENEIEKIDKNSSDRHKSYRALHRKFITSKKESHSTSELLPTIQTFRSFGLYQTIDCSCFSLIWSERPSRRVVRLREKFKQEAKQKHYTKKKKKKEKFLKQNNEEDMLTSVIIICWKEIKLVFSIELVENLQRQRRFNPVLKTQWIEEDSVDVWKHIVKEQWFWWICLLIERIFLDKNSTTQLDK